MNLTPSQGLAHHPRQSCATEWWSSQGCPNQAQCPQPLPQVQAVRGRSFCTSSIPTIPCRNGALIDGRVVGVFASRDSSHRCHLTPAGRATVGHLLGVCIVIAKVATELFRLAAAKRAGLWPLHWTAKRGRLLLRRFWRCAINDPGKKFCGLPWRWMFAVFDGRKEVRGGHCSPFSHLPNAFIAISASCSSLRNHSSLSQSRDS